MKIAFDLTFRLSGGTIPWLAALFANLRALRPSLEAVVFTSRANLERRLLPDCGPWPVAVSPLPTWAAPGLLRPLADLLWQQAFLPALARRHGAGVLFSVGNRCPLISAVPRVLLVGNALTIWPGVRAVTGSLLFRLQALVDGRLIAASAARAETVITESQFELDLLAQRYRVIPGDVLILHNGRFRLYERVPRPEEIDAVLARYALTPGFLLCVAHVTNYSNHPRLIEAYARAAREGAITAPLVLCGSFRHPWMQRPVMDAVGHSGVAERIRILGEVGSAELACLYRACTLFVFPSLVEGFAYTLLEAMTCGAPVVCSRAPAMPETCAGAAVYFDPEDVEEMAQRIVQVLQDPSLRAELKRRGSRRVAEMPTEEEVAHTVLTACERARSENVWAGTAGERR